jgi:hypothetical protein
VDDLTPVVTDDIPLRQPPYIPGGMAVLADPAVMLEAMGHLERGRLRAAALRARRVYPGPVGELVNLELNAWSEWGYRLGSRKRVMVLVEHIEQAVLPEPVIVPAA